MPPEEPTLPAPAAPPPLRGHPPIRRAPRLPPNGGMGWGQAGRRRGVWIAVAAAAIAAVSLALAAVERRAWLGAHPWVPNLIGKSLAEAGPLVVPLHFGLIVNGTRPDPVAPAGTILAQNPPPGRRVLARSIIQLKVSQGSGIVPLLRGAPVHEAAERLEASGLRLGRVHYIEDDAQAGTVLEQFTPPGWQLGANDSVDVLVSQGPAVGVAGLPPGGAPSAPATAVPSTAAPALGIAPRTIILGPTGQETEGSARVGSAAGDCPPDTQRQRDEVCREPADHPGAQSDLHRREHRDVPPGP